MTDAGEKLAKRIEHSLGFQASVNYERKLTLNEVVEAFRAELERAAEIADECGTVTFSEEAFEIAAAIRRRKD